MRRNAFVGLAALLALAAGSASALAQGTAFTYQGQLKENGNAKGTAVDFEFRLFDSVGPGTTGQVGPTITQTITPSGGLFTANLDFLVNAYTANAPRYLEVKVKNSGTATFQTLTRQRLTPAPFSLATRGINVNAAGDAKVANGNFYVPAGKLIGTDNGVNTNGGRLHIQSGNDGTADGLYLNPFPGGGNVYLGNGAGAANLICYDRVGIGTNAPNRKLEVVQDFHGISHRSSDGTSDITTFVNSFGGWIGTVNNKPLVFYTNDSGGQVILSTSGNLGIGTVPTTAKLEVRGNAVGAIGGGLYFNSGGGLVPFGAGAYNISIYGENNVAGGAFLAFSDARIKQVQGRSDAAHDLETLLGLEVSDYTFKDTVARGTRPNKKVIAQQVEKVYPQAVSTSTDVVPDIYTRATTADGWVTLATDLKVGDKVRLIGEKEEGIHEVLEVRGDGSAFRTDFKPASGKVFVYGRQVNDFMSVDYEAIAMLNVSATQELARQNAQMKAQIQALQDQITSLKVQTAALLDARIEKHGGAGETLLAAQAAK